MSASGETLDPLGNGRLVRRRDHQPLCLIAQHLRQVDAGDRQRARLRFDRRDDEGTGGGRQKICSLSRGEEKPVITQQSNG